MEKLQLPHAKLLYFVSEIWKSKQIDDNEKTQLKEKIISDEPIVFEYLDQYESNGSLDQLRDNLISIIRQIDQKEDKNNNQNDDENDEMIIPGFQYQKEENIPDDLSSPLGNALLFNKKKNQSSVNNYLKDVLRPIDQNHN